MLEEVTSRVQRELFLTAFGVPIDRLDRWVVDRLTAVLEEVQVTAGDVLWSAGAVVEFLYFMFDGRAESRREGFPSWTFEGKWFLGALEGNDAAPARRTLVATKAFYALRLPRRAWFDLLEDSFELARLSLVAGATAVARLDERVVERASSRAPHQAFDLPDEPLTTVERLAFLTELEQARGAGVQALADLAAITEEVRLNRGDVLFRVGEVHEHLFLIVEGQIQAARSEPEVRRVHGTGDLVGGLAAFSDRVRAWEAWALEPTRLLKVPVEAWFDLFEEHFDLVVSTRVVLGRERDAVLEQLAAEAGPGGLVLT